jgi:hypothetical protein
VGRDGDRLERALGLVLVEALLGEARPGAALDEALGARAGGHPLGLDAGQGAGAALGRDRGPEQRVDLLGGEVGGGGVDRLGVARRDRDLGPQAVLALAHALGDVRGEGLGLERLAEHDLVDRLSHHLLEAGHVDARLVGIEIDEAFELRVVELGILGVAVADPQDLLDAGDSDPREAQEGARRGRLKVGGAGRDHGRALGHRAGMLRADRGYTSPP